MLSHLGGLYVDHTLLYLRKKHDASWLIVHTIKALRNEKEQWRSTKKSKTN
jgi:hypothetical protein